MVLLVYIWQCLSATLTADEVLDALQHDPATYDELLTELESVSDGDVDRLGKNDPARSPEGTAKWLLAVEPAEKSRMVWRSGGARESGVHSVRIIHCWRRAKDPYFAFTPISVHFYVFTDARGNILGWLAPVKDW